MAIEGLIKVEHKTQCAANVVLCYESEWMAIVAALENDCEDERVIKIAKRLNIIAKDETLEDYRQHDEFG